jgi:hypothetical protein
MICPVACSAAPGGRLCIDGAGCGFVFLAAVAAAFWPFACVAGVTILLTFVALDDSAASIEALCCLEFVAEENTFCYQAIRLCCACYFYY